MQDVFEIDVKGVEAVDYRETENRAFIEHHSWMYDPIDLVQFIFIHFSISSIVKKVFPALFWIMNAQNQTTSNKIYEHWHTFIPTKTLIRWDFVIHETRSLQY